MCIILTSPKKFKISGGGASAFRKLYEIYKKNEKKNIEKNKIKDISLKLESVDFSNLNPIRDFSKWEQNILDKIKKAGFEIEFKHRKFKVKIDSKYYIYIPDVMIFGFCINGKKIIIEAHEKLLDEDIEKYRKFMKEYRNIYYLIMIVEGSELRKWNENFKTSPLFDDIWVNEDVNFLIDKMNEYRKTFEKKFYKFPKEAYCGRKGCGEEGKGYEEIEKIFGYRDVGDGKIIPQSYCRYCRSIKYKIQPSEK